MGVPRFSSSIYRWMFDEINHPAIGDSPISGNPHTGWGPPVISWFINNYTPFFYYSSYIYNSIYHKP